MAQTSNVVLLVPISGNADRDLDGAQRLINAATTSFVLGNIDGPQFRARISEIVNGPNAVIAGLNEGEL